MTQPLTVLERIRQECLAAMEHQRQVATTHLNLRDYSKAATACHRALQYRRQAEVLTELRRNLEPAP